MHFRSPSTRLALQARRLVGTVYAESSTRATGGEFPDEKIKYLYGGDDPINRLDASGKDFIDTLGAVAITVGSLANQAAIVVTTVLDMATTKSATAPPRPTPITTPRLMPTTSAEGVCNGFCPLGQTESYPYDGDTATGLASR
jgi:hypothetical protein